jgi:hypothetical protein
VAARLKGRPIYRQTGTHASQPATRRSNLFVCFSMCLQVMTRTNPKRHSRRSMQGLSH